jgi:chromate transporter
MAFALVGLTGFGGVLPWTQRMIVDRKRWLNEREFAELLPLAQLLPGPNVANIATILGQRYRGPLGSIVAVFGLYLFPSMVTIGLGLAYARWSSSPITVHLLSGLMPAATGLVVATSLRLVRSLPRTWRTSFFVALTAVTVGILQWPLLAVLALSGPVAVWLAYRTRRGGR